MNLQTCAECDQCQNHLAVPLVLGNFGLIVCVLVWNAIVGCVAGILVLSFLYFTWRQIVTTGKFTDPEGQPHEHIFAIWARPERRCHACEMFVKAALPRWMLILILSIQWGFTSFGVFLFLTPSWQQRWDHPATGFRELPWLTTTSCVGFVLLGTACAEGLKALRRKIIGLQSTWTIDASGQPHEHMVPASTKCRT
ncbi:MAG: hypothetical protein WC734_03975 [Patescibacteria group bacterium]|jgi:hypothetical protein